MKNNFEYNNVTLSRCIDKLKYKRISNNFISFHFCGFDILDA